MNNYIYISDLVIGPLPRVLKKNKMNDKILTTVDGFFIFRVISFLSLFLLKKLGYLFPFDLFGQF